MIRPNVPRTLTEISPGMRTCLVDLLIHRTRRWPLYLHGRAGRGKTCAGLVLIDQIPGSFYWTLDEVMDHVYERRSWMWHYASKGRLVIVDEIGIRSSDTDREYVALKTIADLREHRPVIWISNLDPTSLLQKYDDRIHSRLTCGTVLELTGPDRRRTTL